MSNVLQTAARFRTFRQESRELYVNRRRNEIRDEMSRNTQQIDHLHRANAALSSEDQLLDRLP